MSSFIICLFFLNIVLINNVYSIKIRNEENPWQDYMKIFDIAEVHKSGVKEDLGGQIRKNKEEIYLFSNGKCPAFSKVISMGGGGWFSYKVRASNLTKEQFLHDARTGDLPEETLNLAEYSRGVHFPTINRNNSFYYKFKSPIEVDSAYACSQYANTLEHNIISSYNNTNCIKSSGECIKQSAIYDFSSNMCFILYTLKQKKIKNNSNEILYKPFKSVSNSIYAYLSSNIRKDWRTACPVKPVKGVVFGKYINNKCEELEGEKIDSFSIENCGSELFDRSSEDKLYNKTEGIGYNIGTYINGKGCFIYKEKPSCFLYNNNAFSFTSLGLIGRDIYDLPPCIPSSYGWEITAKCEDHIPRNYTCLHNNLWVSFKDNVTISNCRSDEYWENYEQEQ